MKEEWLGSSIDPDQTFEEIQGENPGSDLPGQRFFEKEEIEKESERLRGLRTWARENKRRLLLSIPIIGGVAVVTIGSIWMVKHFEESDFWVDITKKRE